jgi:integrase/recombinase XerD
VFEQIFSRPYALARYRNGPMAEERRRYLVYCAETRMSAWGLRAVAIYTLAVANALRLADRPGELIGRTEIEAVADRWIRRANRHDKQKKKHKRGGSLWQHFKSYAVRWLKFLGRLQTPTPGPRPYDDRVAQFIDHMRRERGLSPQTIAHRCRTIGKFLTQIDEAGLRFDTIVVAQVDELLAQKVRQGGYARITIKSWASAIRPFCRFAEERGWCRRGMADAIMTPRVYRYEHLPMGPSWHDVNRMLAVAQGDRPVDIRDRALLMLLAVYGLRAGEVATLRLENFDWERETLGVLHNKSQRQRTYPLCRPVGDAVLRYLREVRPRSDRREVFLTLVRTFRPLQSCAVSVVVSQRLHALGLILPHYGSHALRHACATHLLAQGLSLKEIGDHLGHQHPETTRIYAKVDLAGLRRVGDFDLEGLL